MRVRHDGTSGKAFARPIRALLARRRLRDARRPEAERPPRLVLRFALVSAVCLGAGAAAILLFTRHLNAVEAERTAAVHAEFLAERILSDELTAADFASPVTGPRRAELDEVLARKILRPGTVLVTLSRPDRVVTYATDHELIGRAAASEARTSDALRGTLTSDVTTIADPTRRGAEVKVLRSYVPLRFGRDVGVIAIHQDYGPIEAAARAALLPVAGILELVLILLFVLLVPLLARVSRRLRRYLERIQHQAFHDDLTGLPNRLQLREQVSRAVEAAGADGSHVAVLVVGLDRFREINETLGHESGDELLRAVGDRLRDLAADTATLARLGGDEFGLVAAQTTTAEAIALAEAVRRALETPFVVRDIPLLTEASVGISLFPEHGADEEALLQTADVALNGAKERHLGVALYDPALATSTATALTLVSELRPALERDELVVHFQPQIGLPGASVVGAEALVRWNHPARGLLQPGAFVPYVERTGASTALSDYVLAHAVGQLGEWRRQGFDLSVAVNLTMFDLVESTLPAKVAAAVAEAGIEPDRVELEITESMIMVDPARVREAVEQLKAIGVCLAIDDFGTGFSSLSYLKTLPVDVIKIDRSFVMAMGASESDRAIVRSTIDLAHNLGVTVVAEGVDDAATLDELARYGCDVAQGFHISRPCAAADFWPAVSAFADDREPAARVA